MAILLTGCANEPQKPFNNTEIVYKTSLSQVWDMVKAYWNDNRKHAVPAKALPIASITLNDLNLQNEDTIYKLGHSSTLIKVDGEYILIDPVFSQRAFPVQWFGPKRFHPVPITVADLPEISAVVISHDHYDHLDKHTIQAIEHKVSNFIVPLGVGKHLTKWDIPTEKITELDWWQSKNVNGVELIATPSQHFSGRTLMDRDHTLWASWVIKGWETKLFYSGDSGYFSGFKEIGNKYGPFDVTLIETGAYHDLWADIHMLPEQSIQAHIDLKGRVMMPVHNSTFDLALHDWFEPLEQVTAYAKENDIQLATPIFGMPFKINESKLQKVKPQTWWRDVINDPNSANAN